jgi:hypothetical protein
MRKKDFDRRKDLELERKIVKPPVEEEELKSQKIKI